MIAGRNRVFGHAGGQTVAGRGFTLIELLVSLVVVAFLAVIAIPGYLTLIKRTSREAAKAELLELAARQEKIFLNSNQYTASITKGYDGTSDGGLGVESSMTRDGKYMFSMSVPGLTFTLKAAPVSGTTQDGDGSLELDSSGRGTRNRESW